MRRLVTILSLVVLSALAVTGLPKHTVAANQSAPSFIRVCGAVPHGFARCHAILLLRPDRISASRRTPRPTATNTAIATATSTAVATATSTATATVTATATATQTATATATATAPPTSTATATATATAIATATATLTPTATGTATPGTCSPPASPPSGYGPCDLQSAYALPSSTAGFGQTVAVVDAYDDPNAEQDLGVYRSEFGLPPCSSANGCFRKVDQNGGTSYPSANGGWAQEISLDLDMVSAICPNCHILLIEASSSNIGDLGTAENTAATLGATEISNSYGGSEFQGETSYDSDYDHPGIPITVSAGDGGYGAQYPAASPYVTAVGGTTLNRDSTTQRGWSETAWSCSGIGCTFFGGTGSGCSSYEAQPSWQSSVANITKYCAGRAIGDVAADADPNTGVAVYDSYAYQGQSGWLVFGGTSVASPLIAGVYALAGNAASVNAGSYSYSHTGSLNDVTSGSNGSCGNDLCTATVGWDGPTGNGTPNGAGAF